MTRYGMVIDLGKCVGCSACQIACKVENGTGEGQFLSYHEVVMAGEFPDVTYRYIPTMCNHCQDAPCVAHCPSGALSKQDGLTVLDADTCIGCGMCAEACPYGFATRREPAAYEAWASDEELVAGCTSSGAEVAAAAGVKVPYASKAALALMANEGKAQKCGFCSSRRAKGEDPYCVHMCPAGARVWGDLDDPDSEAAALVADGKASVSHPEYGTEPSVYYVGSY